MINLARIHAYRSGIFQLFDVPKKECEKRKKHLISEGYVITHVEYV
jgi:predicted kinase